MHRTTLLFALFALAGCGSSPALRATPPPPPVEVEMEPVMVEATEDGQVEAFDAAGLFEEAQAAFARQDWPACDAAFGRLIEKFPDSRYLHASLYNRGLCLEYLRQHGLAAQHFRRHAQLSEDEKDRLDGLFRLGFNLVRGKQYYEAVHLYDQLLREAALGTADKAECHLRRGTAWMYLDKAGQAEKDLKLAMALTREAYEELVDGNELFAEAHFRRGEIYQRLAHAVRLKLPVQSMKGDLAAKVRFFRQAQASYIDALNVRHSYWATASGLRLGELYEEFYRDVLGAEVPADFDAETRRFYIVELKRQLQPLLEQSLAIYEKNITMSERIGAQNEWVAETEARVKRLRSLIEETVRTTEPAEAPKGPSRG
ncbi:MAG: hypothetical protein KC549_02225 [Myxococcales bacterium]|nr:hypothetical protein [Myxococcales bacterium]MCB9545863.1 hypothetical protein [Myxococcales bacterium]